MPAIRHAVGNGFEKGASQVTGKPRVGCRYHHDGVLCRHALTEALLRISGL